MKTKKWLHRNFFLHFEWIALMMALVAMAFINPAASNFSFCLFHNLGIDFCVGCGLGRSVAYIYRGDLAASFAMHPAGVFAVMMISSRIVQIFYRNHKLGTEQTNEKNI